MIDSNAVNRAAGLVDDAKKGALRTKFGVSLTQYLREKRRNWKEEVAKIGGVVGASTASFFIASAIAGAAGIASGAATFGIAPVVGVAVGIAVAKAYSELSYNLKTRTLDAGLVDDDDGIKLSREDATLLVPAMMKVIRKLERVNRRVNQINLTLAGTGVWKTVKGFGATVRHPVTAARALHHANDTLKDAMVADPYADAELNRRLQELRFYCQVIWNYLQDVIDGHLVTERNRIVGYTGLIFGHIVRQVHVTGRHEDCNLRECYNISLEDWKREVRYHKIFELDSNEHYDDGNRGRRSADASRSLLAHGAHVASEWGTRDSFRDHGNFFKKTERDMKILSKLQEELDTDHSDANLANEAAEKLKVAFQTTAKTVGQTVAHHGKDVTSHALTSAAKPMAHATGATVAQGVGGAGVGGVLALAIGELTTTVTNRLTRRAVINSTSHAFNFYSETKECRNAAMQEFASLIKGKDITDQAMRVAAKCASYVRKIRSIEANPFLNPAKLHQLNDFSQSQFSTCKEAYDVVKNLFYLFRNYEKMITFFTYFEAILLQVEEQIVTLNIGVKRGDIVDVGTNAVRRPKPRLPQQEGADRFFGQVDLGAANQPSLRKLIKQALHDYNSRRPTWLQVRSKESQKAFDHLYRIAHENTDDRYLQRTCERYLGIRGGAMPIKRAALYSYLKKAYDQWWNDSH